MSTEQKLNLLVKKFEIMDREQNQFKNDLSQRAKRLPTPDRLLRKKRERRMNDIIASFNNNSIAA